jgi:fumarate hydratase class I
MIELVTPLTEAQVRELKVGDEVRISGVVFTGRDAVHRYLHAGGQLPPGIQLSEGVIYHCGPVVMRDAQGQWKVTAAGPTTSSRHEPYQPDLIRRFKLRGIMGKGGMGAGTLSACGEVGCVYLHAVGGAAQVLADCIKAVRSVHFLEQFGPPEALWELELHHFPAVVTMDAHGQSLHERILADSQAALARLL